MLIETLTGNQNFPGKLAKVYAFVVPSRRFPAPGEVPLFTAAKEATFGVRKHSGGGRILACEGMSDAAGFFNQTTYEVPEGLILKVFATKKTPVSDGTRVGAVFIQTRADAALQRIEVVLNDHPGATITRAHIEGRFDVVSLEDAEKAGVRVLPMNRRTFFAESVKGLISRKVIAPETKAKPVVSTNVIQNSAGEEVEVQTRASKRMLDV